MLTTGVFAVHIHPELTIIIDGDEQTVPANLGIAGGEFEELHTHDTTGRLHVESEVVREFNLEEFFNVWDAAIADSIIQSASGERQFADPEGHETRCRLIGAALQITINGQPAPDRFEAVELHDLDNIVVQALTNQRKTSTPGVVLTPTT